MLANRESKGKEEEEEDEEKEKEKEKEEKEEKGEKKKADRTEKVWSELDSDEAELIAETKRGYEQRGKSFFILSCFNIAMSCYCVVVLLCLHVIPRGGCVQCSIL